MSIVSLPNKAEIPMPTSLAADVQSQLDELHRAPTTLKYHNPVQFTIALLRAGAISGSIEVDQNQEIVAGIDELYVAHQLRGHGIGERLLRSFTVAAKNADATCLSGDAVNPASLRMGERVFGADNVHIYDYDGPVELPITVTQACQSIELAKGFYKALLSQSPDKVPDVNHGFIVRNYLDQVDTKDWEKPMETTINS